MFEGSNILTIFTIPFSSTEEYAISEGINVDYIGKSIGTPIADLDDFIENKNENIREDFHPSAEKFGVLMEIEGIAVYIGEFYSFEEAEEEEKRVRQGYHSGKEELKERLNGRTYKCLIPEDITPPLGLNKPTMDKYRKK